MESPHPPKNVIDRSYDSFNKRTLNQLRGLGYYPSSETEIQEIETFLEKSTATLVVYDQALDQAESDGSEEDIVTLEAASTDLIQARKNARSLLAPIRRLPMELLYEIFSAYVHLRRWLSGDLENYALTITEARNRSWCPTMVLTWICSSWRTLALDRPALWSSIYAEADAFSRRPSPLTIFYEYLARSRQAPLKIYFGTFGAASNQRAIDAFKSLLMNMYRWRHVILEIAGIQFSDQDYKLYLDLNAHSLRDGTVSCLPELEYLQLESTEEEPIPWFLSCPNLQVYHTRILFWSAFKVYNFSNLTLLRVNTLHGNSIAQFMRQMPKLVEFHLDEFELTGAEGADRIVYCSSAVASLHLSMASLIPKAWDTVHLPKLTSLALSLPALSIIHGVEYSSYVAKFSNLLLASQCKLHTLKLYGVPTQDALDFIAEHPSVSDLSFSSQGEGNLRSATEFLLALAINGEDDCILAPNLQFFSMGGVHFKHLAPNMMSSDFDFTVGDLQAGAALCRMVESRVTSQSTGLAKLQRVTLGRGVWLSDPGRTIVHTRLAPLGIVHDEAPTTR